MPASLKPVVPPGCAAECVELLSEFVERSPAGAEDVLKVQALLRSLRQR